MNIRRCYFHLLLALLLVFSQQMGFTHALSHVAAVSVAQDAAQPDDDGAGVTRLGLDHNCAQCQAFAQLASAADTRFSSFPLAPAGAAAINPRPAPLDCQRVPCAFRSRAPPLLS